MTDKPPPLVIDPAIVLVKPRFATVIKVIAGAIGVYGNCTKDPACCRAKAGRALWGGLLSLAITWFDRRDLEGGNSAPGEFSHAGVTVDGRIRDATVRSPVVDQYALDALNTEHCRDFVAYAYRNKDHDLRDVYKAHDSPRIPDEPRFSMEGLMRLGLIMLTTRSRFGSHVIGRALVTWASRKDPAGLFCTEFLAKSFMESNIPLCVTVHPGRMVPFGGSSKDTWRKVVENRLLATGETVNDETITKAMDQLQAFSDLVQSSDKPCDVPVGNVPGQMPPYLVTPNDIAGSPSLDRGKAFPRRC